MDSKHSTSSLGDWALLVGGVGAVGAYFAYENMDAVNAWLMAMQTPAATQNAVAMATDVSLAAWMASNWGVVMLGCAILFAAVKWAMTQRSGAVGSDAGPVVTYRRYNYVNVKLVR